MDCLMATAFVLDTLKRTKWSEKGVVRGEGGLKRARRNYWNCCCVRRSKVDWVIFMRTGLNLWDVSKRTKQSIIR